MGEEVIVMAEEEEEGGGGGGNQPRGGDSHIHLQNEIWETWQSGPQTTNASVSRC